MRFKSKIDLWFHLVMLLCISSCIMTAVLMISHTNTTTVIVCSSIILSVVILAFPIYLGTYYVLEEKALYIRCGFCTNTRIPYTDITSIRETKDPSASAGLSLDRISIQYSKGEILISPKNKQEFLRLLKERVVLDK